MKLPKGLTEAYVLAKLEHAVKLLSHSFVFGYFDLADIQQEARQEGIRKLPKYQTGGLDEYGEPIRKLESFFFAIIKNHLINLVRNKYRRSDPPCTLCHQGREHEHLDGKVCEKYAVWRARNNTKANLVKPFDLDNIADEHERSMHADSDVEDTARVHEATSLLDELLAPELRSDYLRMRAGEKIPKSRRLKVQAACKIILKDFLDVEEGASE